MSVSYVLADNHGYFIKHDVFSGRYMPVGNEILADKWDARNKAQNVLSSSLPKYLRKRFHVRETECKEILPPKEKYMPITNSRLDNVVQEQSHGKSGDKNIDAIKLQLDSIIDFVKDAEQRRDELIEQLSQVDRELSDVAHYMEFYSLNACEGYKAYKMMHIRRVRRRRIKNELELLSQLGECKLDSSTLTDVQSAIRELKNRSYKPRELPELFIHRRNVM